MIDEPWLCHTAKPPKEKQTKGQIVAVFSSPFFRPEYMKLTLLIHHGLITAAVRLRKRQYAVEQPKTQPSAGLYFTTRQSSRYGQSLCRIPPACIQGCSITVLLPPSPAMSSHICLHYQELAALGFISSLKQPSVSDGDSESV